MLKKIIIFLIIIVILLSIIIVAIKLKEKNDYEIDLSEDEIFIEELEENEFDSNTYIKVMDCINLYVQAINTEDSSYYGYDDNGDYISLVDELEKKKRIYNILSKAYIEEKNITADNVYEYVETLKELTLFSCIEINKIPNENLQTCIVQGIFSSMEDYSLKNKVYLLINIDEEDSTFSIRPLSEEEYNNIKNGNKINLDKEKIEKNENNEFTFFTSSEEDVMKEYINQYKRICLADPQLIYERLDTEYREKRFGSLENFEKFVEENRDEIISIFIEKYQINEYDNYKQYICIDRNNKYYIFNENSIGNYTILLDIYTVDLPQIKEKYEKSKEKQKVSLNINKFIYSINEKNYKYAYRVLAESFRNNNYKTEDEFKEYIKNTFFEKNSVKYNSFSQEADNYIYEIEISDKTENIAETKKCTIIMQLGEGTEYVMSFNIE